MKVYIFLGILCIPLIVFSQKKWTLQEAVDYAIKNNLQVIDKQLSLKVEENNLQMAKNEYFPSFSAGMNNHLRFGQTQGFQGSIGRNDNFNNEITASSNILLYNGGRLEKQRNKKKYDVEVAQHNIAIMQDNLTLQIIQQYLSILIQKEVVKIHQKAVENAQKLHQKAQYTTQAGTTAKTILSEAQSALAKEKQNLKQAEIEEKKALFSLSQTLQLTDFQNFDVEEIDTDTAFFVENQPLTEVLENVNTHHPLIKSAESSIKSAEAQTKIVKSAFFPSISLTAGVGSFYYNSLVTDITGLDNLGIPIREKTLFDQYKTNFFQQIGLSVTIPIFNKRNTQIQVEQAKISEEIAKNNLNIQRQELLKNIQKVYFDLENHYQVYITAQETEKSTLLALEFAEKSYEAGINSIYDLNNARNNYINAQSSVVQAKYNYIFTKKIIEVYVKP